jgi:putative component of membrane protein insertase Oxa1/YidC/SpoIIIJ protein YidD
MRQLAIRCIRFYQRRLSPHKGFQCAYRIVTGRDSCSTFAVRSMGRVGVFASVRLIGRRFRKCAAAHRCHLEEDVREYRGSTGRPGYQSGHCDVPVGDCAGDCAEAANVGDCLVYGCDWDYWRRRKPEKEREV